LDPENTTTAKHAKRKERSKENLAKNAKAEDDVIQVDPMLRFS
jgi:hypothetical protein